MDKYCVLCQSTSGWTVFDEAYSLMNSVHSEGRTPYRLVIGSAHFSETVGEHSRLFGLEVRVFDGHGVEVWTRAN